MAPLKHGLQTITEAGETHSLPSEVHSAAATVSEHKAIYLSELVGDPPMSSEKQDVVKALSPLSSPPPNRPGHAALSCGEWAHCTHHSQAQDVRST